MLLGWFLWLWPTFEFDGLRYAGVLPRIAVVFLVCSVIFLHTNWKQQCGLRPSRWSRTGC